MNKYDRHCCYKPRKKPKPKCKQSKIGLVMVLLGIFTLLALVLPIKYWILILSCALITLGFMLLKK